VLATIQIKDLPYTSVEHYRYTTCLVRPRHRREDIINMDLKEVAGRYGSGWGLVASSFEHIEEPLGSTKGRTFLE
jgi:hypothetical protein